jgi:hypothetical protein
MTKATLHDFDLNISNIGNALLHINYISKVQMPNCRNNSYIGACILEFVIGKLWCLDGDTDLRSLSFFTYDKLKGRCRQKNITLAKWRNNLTQHISTEAFNYNQSWTDKFEFLPGELNSIIHNVNNDYRNMCDDLNKTKEKNEFDIQLRSLDIYNITVFVEVEPKSAVILIDEYGNLLI